MPKMIKKRKDVDNSSSINMTFDVPMLDSLIKYIRCDYVSNAQIVLLYKLINQLDLKQYQYNPDILDRLNLLKITCEGITQQHLSDESVLMIYIKEHLENAEDIMNQVDFERNKLSNSECNMLNTAINERLQYIYIFQVKDDIMNALSDFDNTGFTSYYDIINTLKVKLSNLMVKLQNVSAPDSLIRSFNFSGEEYTALLAQIVAKAKKPSTVLMTGVRQLNAILSPGFQSGRLYTILGGTGRFKSGTLWNICDMIRRYNPQIIPVENGMRKCILFITMENTIYETILRLFDMYNPTGKDIKEMEVEEVAQILREEGHFDFTSEDGIDIELRYYSDLEISPSNIYTLIQELKDQGKEVICLILDYILKLNSDKEHYGDERLRISYAGRELKALAQFFDIPVITAMQINREGNGILESSMQENKEDIGRFIGTAFVGQCWDLIQESDWVAFINLEMQKSTGKWFLSFKRLKIRGKKDPMAVEYFNHPFVESNSIRLAPDVDKPEPLSIISLASDLVSIEENNVSNNGSNARQRPKVDKFGASSSRNNKDFDIVDMDGLLKAS